MTKEKISPRRELLNELLEEERAMQQQLADAASSSTDPNVMRLGVQILERRSLSAKIRDILYPGGQDNTEDADD